MRLASAIVHEATQGRRENVTILIAIVIMIVEQPQLSFHYHVSSALLCIDD
jgi:hypothetical protein